MSEHDKVREALDGLGQYFMWPDSDKAGKADYEVVCAYIAALRDGITANGCEIVDEAEDAQTGERSGPWVRNVRAEAAEAHIEAQAAEIVDWKAKAEAAEANARRYLWVAANATVTTDRWHYWHDDPECTPLDTRVDDAMRGGAE